MTPETRNILLVFVAMVLSLSAHEAAHAFVAWLRGDPTAKSLGRMTLNPLRHVDLFGTILLPLAGAVSGLPVLGWAKPVPVDIRKFQRPRFDYLLVSAAGPTANLLLSFVCICALRLGVASHDFSGILLEVAWLNANLAVFNLLPLPPLDGGTVFASLLPPTWGQRYQRLVAPYGIFILLVLMAAHGLDWLPKVSGACLDMLIHVAGLGNSLGI